MNLTEQFTRTAEAILDLAGALPDDLRVLSFGRPYVPTCDVEMHVYGFRSALALLPVLGGIWQHRIAPHEPGAGQVHHQWSGTFHGSAVSIVAVWDGRNLFVEDITPMVAPPAPEISFGQAADMLDAIDDQDDDDDGCEGHESLAGEHMGETVFCDGTCRPRAAGCSHGSVLGDCREGC